VGDAGSGPLKIASPRSGDRLVETIYCALTGRGNFLPDPGVARPAVAYSRLLSATASRLMEQQPSYWLLTTYRCPPTTVHSSSFPFSRLRC